MMLTIDQSPELQAQFAIDVLLNHFGFASASHIKPPYLSEHTRSGDPQLVGERIVDRCTGPRAWSCITRGFGHGEERWRAFCYHLLMAGYDGWLSIEHEDVLLNGQEGLA